MTPAIVVEGLVKRFGPIVAVDGIDFEVPAGSVFGLLGPNGAGKTTVVRVLSTILAPDAGRAQVLGHDVVREPFAVRYRIGLAGQYAAVDANLTGRENLVLVGRLAHLPRSRAAARAGELLGRLGLDDAASRPVRTYSGGMRRRLDVAAALVHRPPVLFLDEPTTGLDPHSRLELWDIIRELVADGTTVLLTTQYLEEADRLAREVAVIDGGRVIAKDSPAALKARLGSTVINLGMSSETAAARAQRLLARELGVHADREGKVVRLTSNEAPRVLVEALRALDAKRLKAASVSVREPSLDDVFLALTGRRAARREDNGGTTGAA